LDEKGTWRDDAKSEELTEVIGWVEIMENG
jgi:hypothetical protein